MVNVSNNGHVADVVSSLHVLKSKSWAGRTVSSPQGNTGLTTLSAFSLATRSLSDRIVHQYGRLAKLSQTGRGNWFQTVPMFYKPETE